MSGRPERFWRARLGWRLRGATMWPAFIVLTLLDGVLLHLLPPVRLGISETGLDVVAGIIIATFGNLILIGVIGPWLARRMLARRLATGPAPAPPEAELEVLKDRVGTVLLVAGVFGILAAGIASQPLVVSETENSEENARAVRGWVYESGDEELVRNLETANTVRLADGSFRTCIARDDRRRRVCLFVDPTVEPTKVVRDRSQEPNSVYRR